MTNKSIRPVEILVLGKIGVGKSSFINYILGLKQGDENFRNVGSGTRTTEPGIFRTEGYIGDIPFNLYDSMGLEASDDTEKSRWVEMVEYFFSENEDKPATYPVDKPKRGFCHSVFYCIKGDIKLEENDVDVLMIKQITEKYNQKLTVVLTQCGNVPKNRVDALENAIYEKCGKDSIYVIRCNSFEAEVMDSLGNVTKQAQWGINQVRVEVIINFLQTLVKWLPKELTKKTRDGIASAINEVEKIRKDYIKDLKKEISMLNSEIETMINEKEFSEGWTQEIANKELSEHIIVRLDEILGEKKINHEINFMLNDYVELFNKSFASNLKDIPNQVESGLNKWFEDFKSVDKMFSLEHLNFEEIKEELKFKVDSVHDAISMEDLNKLQKETSSGSDVVRVITTLGIGLTSMLGASIQLPVLPVVGIFALILKPTWDKHTKDLNELQRIREDMIASSGSYIEDFEDKLNKLVNDFASQKQKDGLTALEDIEKTMTAKLSSNIGFFLDNISWVRKAARKQDGLKD